MEYHWCQFHIWSSLSGTFPTSPPLHVALSHDLLSALESVWYKRITSLVLCLIHFGLLIFNPKQVKLSVRRDAHAVHNGKPSRPILRQLSIFPCPLLLPSRQFSPLHYGHCIRSQRSRKRKEYSVCPQWEPSDGAYNQPAAPCPHLSNCPFSQTKA